jgi:cobalt/nickel transport system permease protein
MALRHAKQHLQDRLIPLAGITAAFVFAAQMFNFPVAAGTTGHLLGGALAAILLGPSVGVVVVTIVVVTQALAFADGGLTALGYNVFNMAVIRRMADMPPSGCSAGGSHRRPAVWSARRAWRRGRQW